MRGLKAVPPAPEDDAQVDQDGLQARMTDIKARLRVVSFVLRMGVDR